MAILLIRHGETVGNKSRTVQMPTTELSPDGQQQALRLADRIKDVGVSHILCSDYKRTQQTAGPMIELLGHQCELSSLLRERNFGDLRGRQYDDIGEDFFAPDYVPRNGESWEQFDARVATAWKLIIQRAKETSGDLAVITHGLFCLRLVSNHTQIEKPLSVPTHWSNTSVTEIDSEFPHRVKIVNCCVHLEQGVNVGVSGGKV